MISANRLVGTWALTPAGSVTLALFSGRCRQPGALTLRPRARPPRALRLPFCPDLWLPGTLFPPRVARHPGSACSSSVLSRPSSRGKARNWQPLGRRLSLLFSQDRYPEGTGRNRRPPRGCWNAAGRVGGGWGRRALLCRAAWCHPEGSLFLGRAEEGHEVSGLLRDRRLWVQDKDHLNQQVGASSGALSTEHCSLLWAPTVFLWAPLFLTRFKDLYLNLNISHCCVYHFCGILGVFFG